jgi:TPR repeat protein
MFALGAMYSGGHNCPVDRAEAQRRFRAAAELGHGQAQLMLARYLRSGVAGERNLAEARLCSSAPSRRACRKRRRIWRR